MKEHWVIKASKGILCGVAVILISGVIVWLFTNVLYIPRNMVTTEAFARNREIMEEKIDKKADKEDIEKRDKNMCERLTRIESGIDNINVYLRKTK